MVFALASCTQDVKNKDKKEQNAESSELTRSKSMDFLALVLQMSMEDIKLAKMAQERSPTHSIQELAKKIEAGHTMILNHIRVFAEKKGLSLSPEVSDENEYHALATLQGTNFDQEFCGYMVKEHENAIDNFEGAAADESMDADIKSWADSMIPVFRSNMEAASTLLQQNE
ncbi:MAG TPA: DUF4142 domain-containing protein [Bacteroidales bacterium]|nr:DUF4142 domain-containing protein [Bacteroidales bacterium]